MKLLRHCISNFVSMFWIVQRICTQSFYWWSSNKAAASIAFCGHICNSFASYTAFKQIFIIFILTEFFISPLIRFDCLSLFLIWRGFIIVNSRFAIIMLWLFSSLRASLNIHKILISQINHAYFNCIYSFVVFFYVHLSKIKFIAILLLKFYFAK